MFEWTLGHLWTGVELLFAGAWASIWHKGLGFGMIAVLVGLAFGSQLLAVIPMVGPLLYDIFKPLRKELLQVAFCIAVFLAGQFVGSHDEAAKCEARTVVIENVVDRDVATTTPKPTKDRKPPRDKWDKESN